MKSLRSKSVTTSQALLLASLCYLPACKQAEETKKPASQAASSQKAEHAHEFAASQSQPASQPVVVESIKSQQDLEKLRGIKQLNADLQLEQLDNIDALADLQILHGSLTLQHCRLADLQALAKLKTISGDLVLDAELIKSYNGLQQLESVGGNLRISGSKRFAVNTVQGFDSLQQVGGDFIIEGCKIEGDKNGPWVLGPFPKLTLVGGSLIMRNYCGVQPGALFFPMHIRGFSSLLGIGKDIFFECPERVEAFTSLAKVGGKIRVKGCPRTPAMDVFPLINDKK